MPLYVMKCEQCGHTGEYINHIDEYENCPDCKVPMKRILQPFGICMGCGAYGYYDDNLQTYINTNKQRKEEMRKQNVTEKIGKGWY